MKKSQNSNLKKKSPRKWAKNVKHYCAEEDNCMANKHKKQH